MWRQLDPAPFNYNSEYLAKQSTTEAMSWLRIGYLSSVASLRGKICVEVGPGTGVFFETVAPLVGEMQGYDVCGSKYNTVNGDQLRAGKWDVLFGFDVLEHWQRINDLWNIDFEVGYFSFPERPNSMTEGYRHWKPNEHLWHLKGVEFVSWARGHGYEVLAMGHPEDLIRKPWSENEPNITSCIIVRRHL